MYFIGGIAGRYGKNINFVKLHMFKTNTVIVFTMQEKDNSLKKFYESFGRLQGHFHILEQSISVELQLEYFKYSERMRTENRPSALDEERYTILTGTLSDPDASDEELKESLVSLALSKDVKAYRFLEGYVRNAPERVKDWSELALMESRMGLESEFSDEKQIFISTGLGGKGDKLRFFTLLSSHGKQPFEEYQKKVIEREFEYYLSKKDCEIEKLDIRNDYVSMVFLIPIRVDIKQALDAVIMECNQYGNFLSDIFTVTNVKILTEKEIRKILDKDSSSPAEENEVSV